MFRTRQDSEPLNLEYRVKLNLVNPALGQRADSYLMYTLTNAVFSSYSVEGTTEDNKPREEWLI